MADGWHKYSANVENITLEADTGDFFNLEGAGTPYKILEMRVFQRGSVSLVLNSLLLRRGVIVSAAGDAVTEYKYATSSPTATVVVRSLPTADVASTDWEYRIGFNLLQEQVNLPIPELQLPCSGTADFGVAQASGTAHTGVGVQIVWAEYTGT